MDLLGIEVIVDVREDPAFIEEGRKIFPGLRVEMIGIGDVIVKAFGKVMCIEHKAITDFAASTKDDRLSHQPINMIENYDYNAVFIVGDYEILMMNERFASFTEEQYNGKIASLWLKYAVPPITVLSDEHFWRMVRRCAIRLEVAGKPLKKPSIVYPKTDDTFVSMLCCIDRMGESRARLIIEFLRDNGYTFWDLPKVTKKELMSIKGIGSAYADKIIDYSHKKAVL